MVWEGLYVSLQTQSPTRKSGTRLANGLWWPLQMELSWSAKSSKRKTSVRNWTSSFSVLPRSARISWPPEKQSHKKHNWVVLILSPTTPVVLSHHASPTNGVTHVALTYTRSYVPLAPNFTAVDGLMIEAGIQSSVTATHPIRGPKRINGPCTSLQKWCFTCCFCWLCLTQLQQHLKNQDIATINGETAVVTPQVLQYIAGLPIDIDTSGLSIDIHISW